MWLTITFGCCGHSLVCDKRPCHSPPFQKQPLSWWDKVHAEATLEHILSGPWTKHSFQGTVETDYVCKLHHTLHPGEPTQGESGEKGGVQENRGPEEGTGRV